jgi:hypothetical protein
MHPRDCCGVAFAADIQGEIGVDTRNGAPTDQIIEGRQADLGSLLATFELG